MPIPYHASLRRNFRQKLTILWVALSVCFLTQAEPPDVHLPANSSAADIQQALDQLPEGGEVVLAPGTYTLHEPIMLRHDQQTLRGAGMATILFLADHANCPVVILGSPVNASKHPIANVTISDLMINGNREHQDKEMWRQALDNSQINNNGVSIWQTTGARVEHVLCCHCRSGGLVVWAGTRRLSVNDFSAFDNQFDGIACYATEDSTFKGLVLHDNLAAGISLDLGFNKNKINDALLVNNDLGIFMRQSRSNVFSRVTIRQSRNHGVFMAETMVMGLAGWRLSANTECTGNLFTDLSISNSGGNAFFVKDPDCTNNVITNAIFSSNAKGDFFLTDPKLLAVREIRDQTQ